MKRVFALLLALLLLTACAAHEEEPSADDYTLYYAARLGASAGGDAVLATATRVEDSASLRT